VKEEKKVLMIKEEEKKRRKGRKPHQNSHNKQWRAKWTHQRCGVCSSGSQRKERVCKCPRCDVGLCVVPCFGVYHNKSKFLIRVFHHLFEYCVLW